MTAGNERSLRGFLLSAVLLVVIVSAVFGSVCRHQFLMYDDQQHLLDNPRLNPPTWRSVGLFWVEQSYWGLYIPLSYTLFAAEAWISGVPLSPGVFHLGNLLLHLACALLVLVILRRLLRHDGAACAGALLFGLHPVQVESVAWVSETRGLLCAVFSLVALWLFDLWLTGSRAALPIQPPAGPGDEQSADYRRRLQSPTETGSQQSATGVASHKLESESSGRSRAAVYVLASVALTLALLSKPAAVAVPLVAGVLALGIAQRPLRSVLAGLCPWLLLAAGWVVLTKLQQPSVQMAYVPPLWTRPLIAGDALAFYTWELLAPLWYVLRLVWHLLLAPWQGLEPLSSWADPHIYGPDYGRAPAWLVQQWWLYLAWIVPAGLLVLLARLRERRVWLSAAGVLLAWLLPVLGLVPFDFQRISTVADRYLYLSLLGPALALGWVMARRWNRLWVALCAAALCLLAALSGVQVSRWRDDQTLIRHALRVNPHSALAKQHSGVLLDGAGKYQQAVDLYRELLREHPQNEEAYVNLAGSLLLLDRIDEAEQALREAVGQLPMRPTVHMELADLLASRGKTLKQQGKTDQAEQRFDQAQQSYHNAIQADPTWSVPYWSLARVRFDRGATDEAIGLCRKAIELAPYDIQARLELARMLESLGEVPEALNHYREALRIRPDFPRANFNLANLLMERGAIEAAIWHFRAELKSYPDYAPAHVNLGIALFDQAQIDEAIGHYREALRIDPGLMEAHLQLGRALATQGQRDKAAAEYQAALQLVPPDSDQAQQIRRLLGKGGDQ